MLTAGGVELIVGKPLGHGSFGKSVGQDGSAGEFQRFGEGRLGHSFILIVQYFDIPVMVEIKEASNMLFRTQFLYHRFPQSKYAYQAGRAAIG